MELGGHVGVGEGCHLLDALLEVPSFVRIIFSDLGSRGDNSQTSRMGDHTIMTVVRKSIGQATCHECIIFNIMF